jgi:hypothetical protein
VCATHDDGLAEGGDGVVHSRGTAHEAHGVHELAVPA